MDCMDGVHGGTSPVLVFELGSLVRYSKSHSD